MKPGLPLWISQAGNTFLQASVRQLACRDYISPTHIDGLIEKLGAQGLSSKFPSDEHI